MEKLLYSFDYLYLDTVLAHCDVYGGNVICTNFTESIIDRPFGASEKVDRKELEELWKYRCFPKTRANMRELVLDLPSGYNRFEIVRRTHGVMSDDCYWVRFDGEEDLCWDDVKGWHDHSWYTGKYEDGKVFFNSEEPEEGWV